NVTNKNEHAVGYNFDVDKFSSLPFKIEIELNGQRLNALINTGADITLINKRDLTEDTSIYKNNCKINVKSATNNSIKINGSVQNLEFRYKNFKYFMNGYVTNTYPEYRILGKDFILKLPHILITILKSKSKNFFRIDSCKVTKENLNPE
ncbi:hypothetical protein COBT_003468, partial [Conglomerata obtusa]